MVSPSKRSKKNNAPITTSLVSFSLACQTCMKKRATRVALTVAMPSATAALNLPKSRVAANTVRPVPASSAKNTAKYIFRGDDDECADMQASRMPVDQVEQGKQVDPDNVNEVPVQAANCDGSVVFGSEAALPGHGKEPEKNSETDDHVECVQARHDEIEREENFRMAGISVLPGMTGDGLVLETERCAGDVMLHEFFAILDALDAEEGEAKQHGDDEAADQERAAGGLRRPDGENHGQTTADEHCCIGGAVAHVDGFAGGGEVPEIPAAINQVGAEQPAEEHDFGGEENPHAQT